MDEQRVLRELDRVAVEGLVVREPSRRRDLQHASVVEGTRCVQKPSRRLSLVEETTSYGGDKGGFIAGQVCKFSGFVSEKGSLNKAKTADEHYMIITYWRSFEEHEKSHADEVFNKTFAAVADMCSDTKELGYDMLWQGEANPS